MNKGTQRPKKSNRKPLADRYQTVAALCSACKKDRAYLKLAPLTLHLNGRAFECVNCSRVGE